MIKSFRCKETGKIFGRSRSSRLPADMQRTALRKLVALDAAAVLADLRIPPANRLEKLTGRREGRYSIRINDQWRICFRWQRGDAYEVKIVDYH